MTYSYNRYSTEITKEPVTGDDSENSSLRDKTAAAAEDWEATGLSGLTSQQFILPGPGGLTQQGQEEGFQPSCTWVGMKSTPSCARAPHSTDVLPNLNTARTSRPGRGRGEKDTVKGNSDHSPGTRQEVIHMSVGKH